jgi:hypothetical protein
LKRARSNFFHSYLSDRFTSFVWDSFTSPLFDCSVGVGQGSALSPALSGLYLALVIHSFYHLVIPMNINVSFLSFVDDGLFITQSTSLSTNNSELEVAYNVTHDLLRDSGLVVEHDKTEIFHFDRSNDFEPLPIRLSRFDITLTPKTHWRYLGFYFDRKLTFKEHVRFYSTKSFTLATALRMLGNSNRGLLPKHKRLLYWSCVVPVMTYGSRLWYQPHLPTKGHLDLLRRTQRKAALWITGAF